MIGSNNLSTDSELNRIEGFRRGHLGTEAYPDGVKDTAGKRFCGVVSVDCLLVDDRSLLFANDATVNTNSFKLALSSSTNRGPLPLFSICHCKRLFRSLISSLVYSDDCAATLSLYEASGWNTDAT